MSTLLIGTKKGGFIYRSDADRRVWQLSDPIMPGWSVYHMAADLRHNPPRLYAAANHFAWGPSVARSDDGGKTWEQRNQGLGFPTDMGVTIQNVWNVQPGLPSQPGVVYAGVQPAGLFRSEDWGETWAAVEALNRHPFRPFWIGTGGGESCLHSIEIDPRDPNRVYAAISAGWSYATSDGGATWKICQDRAIPTSPSAKKAWADFEERYPQFFTNPPPVPPDVDPAAANEMHKLRVDTKSPDRLWGQGHVGVFRSDDRGEHWEDVTEGLPSFHGFPLAVTRRGPDAAYVVPLDVGGDNFRVCPGQLAVYRTADAGKSWERLAEGLPGPGDYQSVYREGLDTDGLGPEGVYLGTSNGQVFASVDGGAGWQRLPGTLPPVLAVTFAAL